MDTDHRFTITEICQRLHSTETLEDVAQLKRELEDEIELHAWDKEPIEAYYEAAKATAAYWSSEAEGKKGREEGRKATQTRDLWTEQATRAGSWLEKSAEEVASEIKARRGISGEEARAMVLSAPDPLRDILYGGRQN